MNDIDISLTGDEEILAAFRELDYKMQHRRLKQVVSDAANIYVKAAKKNIPIRKDKKVPTGKNWHPPGTGKKSPTKKMGRSRKTATVFVGPRTRTDNPQTDAWYLKFWEYGTSKMPGKFGFKVAYESNKSAVENNMIGSMRKIIERTWRKYAK